MTEEKKKKLDNTKPIRVVYPTPDGTVLNQKLSEDLATESQLIFINGHYKGIDQRIRDHIVTDEISIGDSAKIIAKMMNSEIEIISDDQRIRPSKSEVERLWADNQKAKNILGWQPSFGGIEGFERGIEKTVELIADLIVDIALIIISEAGFNKPEDSRGAITVLEKNQILV